MRPKTRVSCVGLFSPSPCRRWTRLEEFCLRLFPLSFPSWSPYQKHVNIQLDKHANGGVSTKLSPFKPLLWSILTMPCSGTAACTLRLTTWAKAGQCWGGLNPLLGSVALVLLVGTLAGWPLVSYTFMCNRLPCLAALWRISKWMSIDYIFCICSYICICVNWWWGFILLSIMTSKLSRCWNTSALLCPETVICLLD